MCHKPRKFLVSCETEELLSFRQTKWTLKKRRGEQGGVRRGSGPKATSGYTRQLNTQQNFKTYKTNWSLFILLINLIYLFLKLFENFYLKKKKHKSTDFFHFRYVVCCIFQFVQCFKAQGCLCFQLYMGLKHPSFWQAGRRLNKNQNRNKAD